MAKVTDQNIPPELATEAGRLLTPKKNNLGTVTRTSQRKGSRKSLRKHVPDTPLNDFADAAEYIRQLMLLDSPTGTTAPEAYEIEADLRAGIFDVKYWVQAELLTTDYITSYPSSVPDPSPPPYAYRDETNLPTIPTYPDGTIGGGAMEYQGASSGGYFYDLFLTWARFIYRMDSPTNPDGALYSYIVIDGDVSANASHRASKPMLSVISAGAMTEVDDPALETLTPVTAGIAVSAPTQTRVAQSHYWRYRIPQSAPPYFSHQKLQPIVRSLSRMSSIQQSANLTRAMVLLAPRPMFGRGFNNNTQVQTTFEAEPALWFVRGIVPPHRGEIHYVLTGMGNEEHSMKFGNTTLHWYEFSIHTVSGQTSTVTSRFGLRGRYFGLELENWTKTISNTINQEYVLSGKFLWVEGSTVEVSPTGLWIEWSEFKLNGQTGVQDSPFIVTVTRKRRYRSGRTVVISVTPNVETYRATATAHPRYAPFPL